VTRDRCDVGVEREDLLHGSLKLDGKRCHIVSEVAAAQYCMQRVERAACE
jgi:hypothetical protein